MEYSIKSMLRAKIIKSIRGVKPRDKWKVVIVDKQSLKLISSVLRLYDILEEDVSLVESITKSRQPYTDTEAIYFLVPSKESVSRFIDDFTKKGPGWNKGAMYACAHIYFTSALDDVLFTRLASSKASKYIKCIKELFIQFNAYESRVFLTTPSEYPFYNMYSPNAGHAQNRDIDAIVDRLVSVAITLNSNPSIRYFCPPKFDKNNQVVKIKYNFVPPGNEKNVEIRTSLDQQFQKLNIIQTDSEHYPTTPTIAEKVAKAFYVRYKQFRNAPVLDGEIPKSAKDVIIFLDRSVDMYAPLVHEFTYQAMVNDLLDLEQGKKYKILVKTSDKETEHEVVLDEDTDQLWDSLRHEHIADVIETLSVKFKQLVGENKLISEIKKGDMKATLGQMKKVVESVPEFQELQDTYSTHINLSRMCMSIFEEFLLAELALVEQNIVTSYTNDAEKITSDIEMDLIRVLGNCNMEETDRIRLLMLYLISRDGINPLDRRRLQELLECMDIDDKRGLLNMNLLNVRTDRPNEIKKRSSSERFKWKRCSLKGKPKYELSRFIPAVSEIIKLQLAGSLSGEVFPWLEREPLKEKLLQVQNQGSLRS